MGRPQRFAVVGVLWLFAFVIHYMSVRLFQPGSILRRVTGGAGSIGGQSGAALQADIHSYLSLWIPLGLVAFGFVWLLYTEYLTQGDVGVYGP